MRHGQTRKLLQPSGIGVCQPTERPEQRTGAVAGLGQPLWAERLHPCAAGSPLSPLEAQSNHSWKERLRLEAQGQVDNEAQDNPRIGGSNREAMINEWG